ncbi:MAG: hypothetical protein HOV87_27335 [Catenulispora sp.]|nr:hypothetical protein [Catenulispora sp.]
MSTIRNLPHPRPGTPTVDRSGPGAPTADRPAPGAAVDRLDALIWAAARATDDPQLAVGRAREFAEGVFVGLVVGAGSGAHRLNCSVPTASGPVTAEQDLHFEIAAEVRTVSLPAAGGERELCELFALAHVTRAEATAILRTRPLPGADFGATFGFGDANAGSEGYVVRGWRLADGQTAPIDAAGMFAFCCSEASSGEPLPLDPTTRYADARPLVTPPRPG